MNNFPKIKIISITINNSNKKHLITVTYKLYNNTIVSSNYKSIESFKRTVIANPRGIDISEWETKVNNETL